MASGTTQRNSISQRGEKDPDSESVFQYGFRMITANLFLQPNFLQAGPLGGVSWVRVPA
jgi:hypothetical protein